VSITGQPTGTVFWSHESTYKVLTGNTKLGTVRFVVYDDGRAFTSVVASCACDVSNRVAPCSIRGMAEAEAWLRRHAAEACPSFATPTDASRQAPGFRGEIADVVDP
jgi:hypothetical protein